MRKAINNGRLREPIDNKTPPPATTKSSRDAKDAAAADGMGTACIRVEERMVASFHILLLLAFMALFRIKTVEKLRGCSPGEFGKLLGLDRIPEVRCLRVKPEALSSGDAAEKSAVHLSSRNCSSNIADYRIDRRGAFQS